MNKQETYKLVLDLRNALAAAMRCLVELAPQHGVDAFLYEARRAGVKDGIGVRADGWLKEQKEKKS